MISDNHTHIIFDPPDKMVGAARALDFDTLSITEHISQIEEIRKSIDFGSTHRSGRLFPNLESYRGEFAKIDETLDADSSFRLKKGLEVDYIRRFEKEISAFVSNFKWDIVLRSVHEFPNGEDVERRVADQGKDAISIKWNEYIQMQLSLVRESDLPFNVLTHPVRLAAGISNIPDNLPEQLTLLTQACKSEGKAVELNGKDIQSYPALVRILADACSRTGCSVSFGSDSHHAREVGRGLGVALALVNEFKLTLIE